jgi:hypothetical protein
MEKVKDIGEATPEERLRWKYAPQGEELAAKYLKENINLLPELSNFQEDARKYVSRAAAEVLIRNIGLPKNEVFKKNNKKIMDGLKLLKTDKVSVENVYSRLRHLFNHYAEQGEQQRRQAYESLKADFTAKLQQAIQQQAGLQAGLFGGANIDVERHPQFQQEWRKLLNQLDSQYLNVLDEYKRELSDIA